MAMAAVGAGASAKQTHDVAKNQDQEAARGIQAQAGRQREVDARISQEVGALENSSPEAERAKANAGFMTQLRRTAGQAMGGATAGATSERFKADEAGGVSNVVDFGKRAADTLSRISAPGRQRANESIGMGRMGSQVGGIARNAGSDAFLTQLRMRGIGRNPWIDAGASVLGGAAGGMAANGGSGGAGLPSDVVTMNNGSTFTNYAPRRVG